MILYYYRIQLSLKNLLLDHNYTRNIICLLFKNCTGKNLNYGRKLYREMISISTKCLLSDPDIFVCICYIPVLFEFNKILFTPNYIEFGIKIFVMNMRL